MGDIAKITIYLNDDVHFRVTHLLTLFRATHLLRKKCDSNALGDALSCRKENDLHRSLKSKNIFFIIEVEVIKDSP